MNKIKEIEQELQELLKNLSPMAMIEKSRKKSKQ